MYLYLAIEYVLKLHLLIRIKVEEDLIQTLLDNDFNTTDVGEATKKCWQKGRELTHAMEEFVTSIAMRDICGDLKGAPFMYHTRGHNYIKDAMLANIPTLHVLKTVASSFFLILKKVFVLTSMMNIDYNLLP